MPADPRLLQALLDEMRVDELLFLVTIEEIAEAWFRYQRRPHIDGVEDEDPDWWAVELLTDMDHHFKSDELRIRATLDLLIDHADDDVLGREASLPVPLQDFVMAAREQRLRWIERRARRVTPLPAGAARSLGVAPAAGCHSPALSEPRALRLLAATRTSSSRWSRAICPARCTSSATV